MWVVGERATVLRHESDLPAALTVVGLHNGVSQEGPTQGNSEQSSAQVTNPHIRGRLTGSVQLGRQL